jgi:hypothetical protein
MVWILGLVLAAAVAVIAFVLRRRHGAEPLRGRSPKQPVMTITSRIQQAADIDACDRLAAEIVAERPDQVVVLFAELFERRAKFAQNDPDLEAGVASLLWSSFGASRGDDHRIIPEASAAADPLVRWRSAPAALFQHLWVTANAPNFPVAVRALLLQALWELRTVWRPTGELPRPFDVVRAAVSAHLDAAVWVIGLRIDGATRGLEAAKHWRTALRLSVEVGQPGWVEARSDALREGQQLLLDAAPHWALALVEVEIGLAAPRGRRQDFVTDQRLEDLLVTLDDIGPRLETMGHMEHVQEDLLGVHAQVEALLGRGPDQKEISRRRAELHKRVALAAPSGLVASMRWKLAAGEYLQAGLREDGARAKTGARDSIGRAEAQGEFREVCVPFDLSEDDHERMLLPFFDGANTASAVIGRMSGRLFVPSLETGKPAKTGSSSLASQLLVTVPVVDDRTLANLAPDSQELARFEERRALLTEIGVSSAVLISEIFRRLRQELHLHQDDLVTHLAVSSFVEADDLPFIRVGVDRYLRDDHISALHVLVPRVEQMIRRILRAAGTEITALRDGELRERPLGELLRAGEADGTLPSPLARLLQAVLSEDWGLNLRNRTAHGLVRPEDCSQPNVDRVLHIALLLARIRLEEQEPVADAKTETS